MMSLHISPRAKIYIDHIKNRSRTGRKILAAMESDTKSHYAFSAGAFANSSSHGCGQTRSVEQKPGLLRMMMGQETKYTFEITVNPACGVTFEDVAGKPFKPSIERIFAHEMGHGYVYLLHGPFPTSHAYLHLYHEAIKYENIIARELDPDAPERSVSDHGDPMSTYRDF
jgi:hypothetical protein